eukprot:Tbor_TRINITY_DN5739_c0_g1::TRINITY_DN5739_c0_g1_i4::g.20234::m.20234/K11810/SLC16A12; MFS transporter, MCP family, solute carrier family 16 (monocarboxylic acid transporters), member 12
MKRLYYGNPPAAKDSWRSYFVALSGMCLQAIVYGISNTFPSLMFSMENDTETITITANELAWVYSIPLALGAFMAIPAGKCVQRFGNHFTAAVSVIGCLSAVILTGTLATNFGLMVLTYSIPMSFAVGFMVPPGPTATSTWFKDKMALGMGLTFLGGGIGSIIVPPVAGALLGSNSWRNTFLTLAVFTIFSATASLFVCLRPNDENEPSANEQVEECPVPVVESSEIDIHSVELGSSGVVRMIILTKTFIALWIAYLLFGLAIYSFFFRVVPFQLLMGQQGSVYADVEPISVSNASHSWMSMGVVQVISPVLINIISKAIGNKLALILSLGWYATMTLIVQFCRPFWSFILVIGLSGYGLVAFFSFGGALTAAHFHGPNMSVVVGLIFSATGVGALIGPVIILRIVEASSQSSHTGAYCFIAMCFLIAAVILAVFVQNSPSNTPKTEDIQDTNRGSDGNEEV